MQEFYVFYPNYVQNIYNLYPNFVQDYKKSGHNSKLKSLHLFMDECPHAWAVRVWSQPFSIDEVTTQKGKKFKLINLPFYYAGVLEKVLEKNIML